MTDKVEEIINIKFKLKDLIKQATTERSHYYVKSVCEHALGVITELEIELCDTYRELGDLRDALGKKSETEEMLDYIRENPTTLNLLSVEDDGLIYTHSMNISDLSFINIIKKIKNRLET